MKKRMLALAIAIILTLGVAVTGFAGTLTDIEGTDFEEPVNRLAALGVINGYPDGTYKPKGLVTRAEFTKIIIAVTGVGSAAEYSKGATKFTDVAGTHWASGYINIATDLGIIEGYGDGRFGPEDQVTYAQAITMIVRALGYDPAARIKGGYPSGYLAIAAENDITDGVTVLTNVAANRGDIAVIVDNSLSVDMMVRESYGESPTWKVKEGETLLKKLGVEEIRGNVIRIARVDDKMKDNEIRVEIELGKDKYGDMITEEKTYELVVKANPEALFGKAVKLLVKKSKALYVEIDTDVGDVIIDTVELVKNTRNKVIGLDLKVKDKEYNWLDRDTKIYVNFEEVKDIEYEKDFTFRNDNAYGVIILDGKYIKFANLFDFDNGGLVTKITRRREIEFARFEDGREDVLEIYEYDTVYVYNNDFTAASISDIDEDSIIYYWENTDDEVFIVVVNEPVKGRITRARDEKVTINGVSYNKADDSIVSKDNGKSFDSWIKIGDIEGLIDEKVVLYLDLNGDVGAIVGETDVTSDIFYGIVTWFTEGRNPKITIFTKDGKEIDYGFEDRSDAKGYTEKEFLDGKDEFFRVVSYKLDSDSNMAEGKLKEDGIKYTLRKDADKKYVESRNTRFYFTKDTVIMKAVDDRGKVDPEVIRYEDFIKMKFNADENKTKAYVFGEKGKNAEFIVFINKGYDAYKKDIYFGIVTDDPWKVGSDWKVEMDIFGEGVVEFKLGSGLEKDFKKGTIAAFNLDGKDKIREHIFVRANGTLSGEFPLFIGTNNKDYDAKIVKGIVKAIDGKFIGIDAVEAFDDGIYRVIDNAVLYKVDNKYELDGTIRLARIKPGNEIIMVLDENKEVTVARIDTKIIKEAVLEGTGTIDIHDGKVCEGYKIKPGNNVIRDIDSIIVIEPDGEENVLITNSGSTLWFDVQNERGRYSFTVTTRDGSVYRSVLDWTAPENIKSEATGGEGIHGGNHYIEYKIGGLDLSKFTKMYQIKPKNEGVFELTANIDRNLWFKVNNQTEGDHIFLVKKDGKWYTSKINFSISNRSRYELTFGGETYFEVSSLIEVDSKTKEQVNTAVYSATQGLIPIKVRLKTAEEGQGLYGYEAVGIIPVGSENIQLWAKDTQGNWYDINTIGWGPQEGFQLLREYDVTTDVYLISDTAGGYTITFKLVDLKNENVVIAEVTRTLTVPGTIQETEPTELDGEQQEA